MHHAGEPTLRALPIQLIEAGYLQPTRGAAT